MISPLLTKLKIISKRLLGKCVYAYVYLKNTVSVLAKSPQKGKSASKPRHKNNLFNLIALVAERWRLFGLALAGFLLLYYGIGAVISSQINNSLTAGLAPGTNSARYVPGALSHVIKTQVDDSPWTPALPVIFPAAVLDNLPNFQLGVKDSAKYLVKRLAGFYADKNLKEAAELLEYPPDIWLFSQTGEDRLAPGSAKQYRKALALINEFAASPAEALKPNSDEFLSLIRGISALLNRQISILHKHILEHNTDMADFSADDLFYKAQGNIYTAYYMLLALSKDYQDMIVETGQYENMTAALRFLSDAETFAPLVIKNSSPQDVLAANHLLYLAYYIARAQNYLQMIESQISFNYRKQTQ